MTVESDYQAGLLKVCLKTHAAVNIRLLVESVFVCCHMHACYECRPFYICDGKWAFINNGRTASFTVNRKRTYIGQMDGWYLAERITMNK